jgi:lysozyme
MTLERISAFITYCIAVLLAWLGDLSLKDASTVGGVLIGVLMLAINWYYKHQSFKLLRGGKISRGNMNPSIVKRCLVGAVLAIAATLPGFQSLHTSVEGLKLIADYEGCRLQPYQCSAGVWTDGIGNTSGVVPGKPSRSGRRRRDLSPTCCAWSGRWINVWCRCRKRSMTRWCRLLSTWAPATPAAPRWLSC